MPDEKQNEKKHKHPHLDHLEEEAEKAVQDVVEFFAATGEKDTPTSDSDAPGPG
jgi:hypothetical protein